MNIRPDQTLPVETAAGWTIQFTNDDAATNDAARIAAVPVTSFSA